VTDFACPVCLEVLRNPVVLSCAHRFCFSCVATAALYAPDRPPAAPPSAPVPRGLRCDCPVCRKPQLLDDGALRVDPALDDFVREHFTAALAPPPPQSSLAPAEDAPPALDRAPAGAEVSVAEPLVLPIGPEPLASALQALRGGARVPKLLLVGIDGCRADALLLADTPAARALVCRDGAFSLIGAADGASAPGGPSPSPAGAWETLLTGRADVGRGQAPTLFELLASVRPWVRSRLFTSAAALASRAGRGTACIAEPAADDARAAAGAAAALAAASAPDVVVLQLGEVQAAGVEFGFGPHVAAYRDAIAAADRRVATLLDVVRRRMAASPAEDWLVVITTTGGGTARADMPPALAAATAAAEWRRRGEGVAVAAGKPGAPGAPPPSAATAGAFGAPGLPQHEDVFVLLWGRGVRCGELLPTPRPVDALPSALAHFGVLARADWALTGRAYDAVSGSAGWARAIAQIPDPPPSPPPAASADAAQPRSALDALSPDDVAAAAAAIAALGGVPLAFFASVPGLLDPQPMAVVGHRGAGMNAGQRDGAAVRENTVASFAAAASAGATWVEMDVQVTQDGIPVIWHDDEVLSREGRAGVASQSLRALTAAQFQALGPAAAACAPGAPVRVGASCGLLRRFKGAPVGAEAPWDCPAEAPLPTLEEALRTAPLALGFNLELKFVETEPLTREQLDAFLAAVLAVCERAAGSRRVFFSSFDPDAACAMRRLTARWPVLLLTDAAGDPGSAWPRHSDARRNGVRTALAVAVAGGLAGIVTEAGALIAQPALAAEVRATGMLLATWGSANTQPEQVRLQAQLGVCALITDSIRTALTAIDAEPPSDDNGGGGNGNGGGGNGGGGVPPQLRPAAAGAAPPAVRAAVAALPAFLGGAGGLSESMLRQHPLQSLQFSGNDGDVNATFAVDGAVGITQTKLPEERNAGQRVLAAAMAAAPAGGCACRLGVICHSCAFAGGRGGGAGGAAAGPLGAMASIAARGAVGARPQWYRAGEMSPESPSAAPRGLRLNLGQLLLPSPRLWRAT